MIWRLILKAADVSRTRRHVEIEWKTHITTRSRCEMNKGAVANVKWKTIQKVANAPDAHLLFCRNDKWKKERVRSDTVPDAQSLSFFRLCSLSLPPSGSLFECLSWFEMAALIKYCCHDAHRNSWRTLLDSRSETETKKKTLIQGEHRMRRRHCCISNIDVESGGCRVRRQPNAFWHSRNVALLSL